MTVTPERVRRLRALGFSEHGARAYLALLALGTTEAARVCRAGGVPSSKVYYVLDQLASKGLVQVIPDKPRRFQAVPLRDYLMRLKKTHERSAEEIARDLEELSDAFAPRGGAADGSGGRFALLHGRKGVTAKKLDLLAHAQRDVLFFGSAGSPARWISLLDEAETAAARGVRLRFLAPVTAENVGDLDRIAGVGEVRGAASPTMRDAVVLSVADGRQALLAHLTPDDRSVRSGKDVGIQTDHAPISTALRALLECAWENSRTFDEARAELAH